MEEQDNRTPVTLLTGFLGAGKTTLLNNLVRDPTAGSIAVIVNEWGEVGLDHDLIEEATQETVLLRSGCICCSIRGDLGKTLASLAARRLHGKLGFDRVVIETTGMADPGPILHTLVVDEIIAPHYQLDGVVTVADAATGPQTLDAHFEAVNQIAVADLIVVSKTDLVPQDALDAFMARLDGINGTAGRVLARHGCVPTGSLFGLSAMRRDARADDFVPWLGANRAAGEQVFGTQARNVASEGPHDRRIGSASIELKDAIPAELFDFWLDTLIARKGADILRIKGIVHVEDMDWPFVFHGVQHIFDPPVPLKTWSGKDTTSRVVVIGRDIETSELKASLETLRMRPKEPGGSVGKRSTPARETSN